MGHRARARRAEALHTHDAAIRSYCRRHEHGAGEAGRSADPRPPGEPTPAPATARQRVVGSGLTCTRRSLVAPVDRFSTGTAEVRLPSALGHRELAVDNDTTFTADDAHLPDLRLCGDRGCHPAPTGCTPASYDKAVAALDVPKHTSRGEEHCDGKWLVFDVSSRMGPACAEGQAPGCGASLDDRWFFRGEKSGWVPLARGTKAGCADVHRIEPAFPATLCAGLPALRRSN